MLSQTSQRLLVSILESRSDAAVSAGNLNQQKIVHALILKCSQAIAVPHKIKGVLLKPTTGLRVICCFCHLTVQSGFGFNFPGMEILTRFPLLPGSHMAPDAASEAFVTVVHCKCGA